MNDKGQVIEVRLASARSQPATHLSRVRGPIDFIFMARGAIVL